MSNDIGNQLFRKAIFIIILKYCEIKGYYTTYIILYRQSVIKSYQHFTFIKS